MSKVCRTCKKIKQETDFSIATSGKEGNNFRVRKYTMKTQCKTCDATYARAFRKRNKNYIGSGKLIKYKKDRALMSAIRSRCADAKSRSIKHKHIIPYTLTADKMLQLFKKQKGKCAYTQQTLQITTQHLGTLSIDKIKPKLGYVINNVQWVCWAVNRAKGEMSHKMFINMCRTITEKCNDYPVKE